MNQHKDAYSISLQAFHRLPYYLQYLKNLQKDRQSAVSAAAVAAHFNYSEIQVRKDFAAVCSAQGKPKQGFDICTLINDIEIILGYRNTEEAVLVGTGSLGKALLSYNGFQGYGLNIVAAFDADESVIGSTINGKSVLSAKKISEMCRRMKTKIGIITVPEGQAQIVCDQLAAGGVLAIWNFAPVHLSVPENILVQNENMAASLALLSKHLREQIAAKDLR